MALPRTLTGTLLVAGAAGLWGFNGTVARLVMDAGLPPARLAEGRIALAALLLIAWLVCRDRPALRLTWRDAAAYSVFGVLGLVGVQWFYFEAINRIPIGISLVIEYSAPLLVALWVRFVWGRRLPWQAWLALPVAMLGLALVLGVFDGTSRALSGVGIAFSVAASLSYAYYALHAERLTLRRSPVAVLGIGLSFGTIALSVAFPWWSFPWADLSGSSDGFGIELPLWGLFLWVVVLGTVVPFAMLLAGVKRVGADGATVTAMIEPIVAGAIAWALLSQALSLSEMVGGLIVLAAVAFAQISRARAETTYPT